MTDVHKDMVCLVWLGRSSGMNHNNVVLNAYVLVELQLVPKAPHNEIVDKLIHSLRSYNEQELHLRFKQQHMLNHASTSMIMHVCYCFVFMSQINVSGFFIQEGLSKRYIYIFFSTYSTPIRKCEIISVLHFCKNENFLKFELLNLIRNHQQYWITDVF